MVTRRPAWAFSQQTARQVLAKHFGTAGLEGFGFSDGAADAQAIRAAGAVLDYLAETQKSSLEHIDRLLPYHSLGTLEIDESSRRSLEITRTIRDGRREGSLLWVLDRTVTAMGSRLLAEWVANPLTDIAAIHAQARRRRGIGRQSGVVRRFARVAAADLRRRAVVGSRDHGPRQSSRFEFLGPHATHVADREGQADRRRSSRLGRTGSGDRSLSRTSGDARRRVGRRVPAWPAAKAGFIREGFNAELDALRELAHGGKQWIARYQAQEIQRSGIPTLKVGFNKVFGYYIEITNAHREKIPAEYIRKQTIKNAERYITPELKEYEEKVLTADEKAKELEYRLFLELRNVVAADRRRMQATAAALAEIDVLVSLAELARQRNYCRPRGCRGAAVADHRRPAPRAWTLSSRRGSLCRTTRSAGAVRKASNRVRSRKRFDPADHRPEHGGQEHVHPPSGAADADGADRQLRAGPRGDDRRGRPHLRPRRSQRRADPRAEHVHGRDDRDGADSEHGHGAEPGDSRRDRPRHEHLRRHFAGLVGRRVPARARRLPHAVRHALPRVDRPGEIACRA